MLKFFRSHALHSYVALVVLYIVVGGFMPLDPATRQAYNLDVTQARIIGFISTLPLLAVWFAAFYCYARLQRYVRCIRGSKEELAFQRIADGVMVLSWGLIIQALLSLLLNGLASSTPSLYMPMLVIQNYINVAIPVIAFTTIASGTRRLLKGRQQYASLPGSRVLLLVFAFIGTLYSYLVLHLRHTANTDLYHLPIYLILSTLVVPYLYAWFTGLIAVYDIGLHAQVVKGVIYKRSLNFVAAGLGILIIGSIAFQYFNSLFVSSAGNVSISIMLLIDYLLLLGVALGYVLMIVGVRGLQKMEDI